MEKSSTNPRGPMINGYFNGEFMGILPDLSRFDMV
jgi:hypothetical protein